MTSGVDKNCYKQRGWGKIGVPLIHEVSGKYMQRTSVIAGLCDKEVLAPLLFQGSCNTELFITWIAQQLVPTLKTGQVVVMDNASIHKSPCVRQLIEEAGCRLIYLPPYSPDLNPIETFWANMKKWIKEKFKSFNNTWNALHAFFNS